MFQSKAGYIDARPPTANSSKTSCNARPDHTLGPKGGRGTSRNLLATCDLVHPCTLTDAVEGAFTAMVNREFDHAHYI
jgi:hypothetical protein